MWDQFKTSKMRVFVVDVLVHTRSGFQ